MPAPADDSAVGHLDCNIIVRYRPASSIDISKLSWLIQISALADERTVQVAYPTISAGKGAIYGPMAYLFAYCHEGPGFNPQ